MVGYSVVFLILKLIDFSDINDRMDKFMYNFSGLRWESLKSLSKGEKAVATSLSGAFGRLGQTEEQLSDRAKHYKQLYYEVNILTLLTSLLSVAASLYIKISLRKTLIMSITLYRKFIIACFAVVCLFFGIIFHFTTTIMSFARLDVTKWLEGFYLIA